MWAEINHPNRAFNGEIHSGVTDSPFRLHVLLSSAFFRPINYSHNYVLDENNRHFTSCPAAWWSTSAPVDQVAQKAAWQMFLFLAKHLVSECVPQACDLCCQLPGVLSAGCSRWARLWRDHICKIHILRCIYVFDHTNVSPLSICLPVSLCIFAWITNHQTCFTSSCLPTQSWILI